MIRKTNIYIARRISRFLLGSPMENCPIEIISRQTIKHRDAQLVRFVFGKHREPCVAIVFDDCGAVIVPRDWTTPVWDNPNWKIEETEWINDRNETCFIYNGFPIWCLSEKEADRL